MNKILTLICLILAVSLCHGSVVIPGTEKTTDNNMGVFFFGSDLIPAENYYNSLLAMHKKMDSKPWILIVSWSKDTKNVSDEVLAGLKMLIAAGMSLNATTPFYFVGHSSGNLILS